MDCNNTHGFYKIKQRNRVVLIKDYKKETKILKP